MPDRRHSSTCSQHRPSAHPTRPERCETQHTHNSSAKALRRQNHIINMCALRVAHTKHIVYSVNTSSIHVRDDIVCGVVVCALVATQHTLTRQHSPQATLVAAPAALVSLRRTPYAATCHSTQTTRVWPASEHTVRLVCARRPVRARRTAPPAAPSPRRRPHAAAAVIAPHHTHTHICTHGESIFILHTTDATRDTIHCVLWPERTMKAVSTARRSAGAVSGACRATTQRTKSSALAISRIESFECENKHKISGKG